MEISSFLRQGLQVDQERIEEDVELSHSELQTLRYMGGFFVRKLWRKKSSVAQAVAREFIESRIWSLNAWINSLSHSISMVHIYSHALFHTAILNICYWIY